MADISPSHWLRNARPRKPCDYSHPRTMKTKMLHSHFSEKNIPRLGCWLEHLASFFSTLRLELFKKRDQRRMKPCGESFFALGIKSDRLPFEVNIRERKTSLSESATLIIRNFKRHRHPISMLFKFGPWKWFGKGLSDFGSLLFRDFRFKLWRILFQAHRSAWVYLGVPELKGVLEEKPQGLEFVNGRVSGCSVKSLFGLASAPFEVFKTMLKGYLPGIKQFVFIEEFFQLAPPVALGNEGFGRISVSVGYELWNPTGPTFFVRNPSGASLFQRLFSAKLSSLTVFGWELIAEFCGFAPLFPDQVSVFNPPERALGSFIKAGHAV